MNRQSPGQAAEAIISDAEITNAWGHANFGNANKREVIAEALSNYACGWGNGHTITCIISEMDLINKGKKSLTERGLNYLLATAKDAAMLEFAAQPPVQEEDARPAAGDEQALYETRMMLYKVLKTLKRKVQVMPTTDCVKLIHDAEYVLEKYTSVNDILRKNASAPPAGDEWKEEREKLLNALHRDQTGLAKSLSEVQETLDGYHWLTEGRGPYAWNDDRYKAEVLTMLETLGEIVSRGLSESGKRSHAYCCGKAPTYEKLQASLQYERQRTEALEAELQQLKGSLGVEASNSD